MKIHHILVAFYAMCLVGETLAGKRYLKRNVKRHSRAVRQTSADQMVQNILQWLQGVYTQQNRRSRSFSDEMLPPYPSYTFASARLDDAFRQGTLREYLPPSNTERPRPFEPRPSDGGGTDGGGTDGSGTDVQGNFVESGYPPAGSITPQPPFPSYTSPTTEGYPAPGGYPTVGYPTPETESSIRPGFPTQPPSGFTQFPTERPPYPPPVITTGSYFPPQEHAGYPTTGPSVTSDISLITSERPGFPTRPPPGITDRPSYPTQGPPEVFTPELPGFPSEPPQGVTPGFPTRPPYTPQTGELSTYVPVTVPSSSTETFASSTTQGNYVSTDRPKLPGDNVPTDTVSDEDLRHPPHIHDIDVQCAKDMMTINIEFNRVFNGVIYSKGYYNMPECRYVNENSGLTKYIFTVNLNMCGTEFINAFDTLGQSYLENVLVIQNEAGIQEIWDTIRSVRCLWEGNLKEQLVVSLSVGMLTQEIVTFSGDTAMAKLDILLGRGPFGQPANGLVKIGEPMTLVVSVSGDPGFDIQVRDCRATDSTGENIVPLTDYDGCILKPKLFGAFQKTRNTANTGASIIAFAYFNAFKFPDVMDLMIECNIELCKTDCEICTSPNQQLEPGRRRRRDLYSSNQTLHDGVMMGKHLRVVLAEDLSSATVLSEGVCMSTQSFVFTSSLLISLLTASCLLSAYMWLKVQRMQLKH